MEHWNILEKRLKVLAARFWCSKLKKRSQDMLDSVKIDVFHERIRPRASFGALHVWKREF